MRRATFLLSACAALWSTRGYGQRAALEAAVAIHGVSPNLSSAQQGAALAFQNLAAASGWNEEYPVLSQLDGLSSDPALYGAAAAPLIEALRAQLRSSGKDPNSIGKTDLTDAERRAISSALPKAIESARQNAADEADRQLSRARSIAADPEQRERLASSEELRRLNLIAAAYRPYLDSQRADEIELFQARARQDTVDRVVSGIEVEFAALHRLEPKAELIPDAAYKAPLQVVKKVFGDRGSEVRIAPFLKYPRRPLKQAEYVDPDGKTWRVVPEAVNTTGLDGFELVTPPLDSTRREHLLAAEAVAAIAGTGEYGQGIRSSTHMTFSVAHLIGANGDASRLVDAILSIESHWAEIYSAVSPTRYGTIVNRFAVPLASDQKDLLRDLAALPRRDRTMARVRALFESYTEREVDLKRLGSPKATVSDLERMAWKYRAANYKKLFGLLGETQAPVIEFRIADYAEGKELARAHAFLSRLIARLARPRPQRQFADPFAGASESVAFRTLNDKIYRLSQSRYEAFINELGLPTAEYPKLAHLDGPPQFGLTDDALRRLLARVDTSRPFAKNGRSVTYGFEAEFRGEHSDEALKRFGQRREFPYFGGYRYIGYEHTGNHEIRSNGGDKIPDEVFAQMLAVKKALKGDLRGFHLHIRIPKSMLKDIPEEDRNAWISRIGDYAYLWRLQHAKSFFALKTNTHGRVRHDALNGKAIIRMLDLGSKLDLELRGFMGSIEAIKDLTRIILAGLDDPRLIHGWPGPERLLHARVESLADSLEPFTRRYWERKPTGKQKEVLDQLEYLLQTYPGYALPLNGFEAAPYVSELDKKAIQDANFNFKKDLYQIIRKAARSSTFDFDRAYRHRLRRWAQSIDLARIIRASLLTDRETIAPRQSEAMRNKIDDWLRGDGEDPDGDFEKALGTLPANDLMALLEQSRLSEDLRGRLYEKISQRQDITDDQFDAIWKAILLADDDDIEYFRLFAPQRAMRFLSRALNDSDPRVRESAEKLLSKTPIYNHDNDAASRALFIQALSHPNRTVRRAAIGVLELGLGQPHPVKLVEPMLDSPSVEVRSDAVKYLKSLLSTYDAASLDNYGWKKSALERLLTHASSDNDLDVRRAAQRLLTRLR